MKIIQDYYQNPFTKISSPAIGPFDCKMRFMAVGGVFGPHLNMEVGIGSCKFELTFVYGLPYYSSQDFQSLWPSDSCMIWPNF